MPVDEPSIPPDLLDVLSRLGDAFSEHDTQYAIIGGIAANVRGFLRTTIDVDVMLYTPQMALPGLLESLARRGFEFDLKETIKTWNQHHLVALYYGPTRVDWMKPVVPVYRHVLDRATWEQIEGRKVRVADAAGLIVMKLIAWRPKDIEDIKVLLAANRGRLDLDWIRSQWLNIGDADDEIARQFESLVAEFYEDEAM